MRSCARRFRPCSSDEYRSRVEQIEAHFASLQEQAFGELVEDAQRQGIALRTPAGFSFAPARGRVMPHEEFEKLPAAEKERIAQAIRALQEKLGGSCARRSAGGASIATR